MSRGTNTAALDALLASDQPVERIATGFGFTEGPVWMPDGSLHFSDIVQDARRRWHPQDGVSVVRQPSNKGNGMTIDSQGRLVWCEHSTSRMMRESSDGTDEVIATHYGDRELNSPNDVVVASDDSIIFTDPDWGRTLPRVGLERPVELDFKGVFRVPATGGDTILLADDFDGPNGLCFSPDESLLYVNDTNRAHIRVFDVGPDYSLSNGRVFAENIGDGDMAAGVVDGMKVDADGRVYVTGPVGIWVFSPEGEHLGIIEVPEVTGNLNWGDDDWKTLYIAANTSIYRVRMTVAGNRLAYMR
jgi:gluconolactonase